MDWSSNKLSTWLTVAIFLMLIQVGETQQQQWQSELRDVSYGNPCTYPETPDYLQNSIGQLTCSLDLYPSLSGEYTVQLLCNLGFSNNLNSGYDCGIYGKHVEIISYTARVTMVMVPTSPMDTEEEWYIRYGRNTVTGALQLQPSPLDSFDEFTGSSMTLTLGRENYFAYEDILSLIPPIYAVNNLTEALRLDSFKMLLLGTVYISVLNPGTVFASPIIGPIYTAGGESPFTVGSQSNMTLTEIGCNNTIFDPTNGQSGCDHLRFEVFKFSEHLSALDIQNIINSELPPLPPPQPEPQPTPQPVPQPDPQPTPVEPPPTNISDIPGGAIIPCISWGSLENQTMCMCLPTIISYQDQNIIANYTFSCLSMDLIFKWLPLGALFPGTTDGNSSWIDCNCSILPLTLNLNNNGSSFPLLPLLPLSPQPSNTTNGTVDIPNPEPDWTPEEWIPEDSNYTLAPNSTSDNSTLFDDSLWYQIPGFTKSVSIIAWSLLFALIFITVTVCFAIIVTSKGNKGSLCGKLCCCCRCLFGRPYQVGYQSTDPVGGLNGGDNYSNKRSACYGISACFKIFCDTLCAGSGESTNQNSSRHLSQFQEGDATEEANDIELSSFSFQDTATMVSLVEQINNHNDNNEGDVELSSGLRGRHITTTTTNPLSETIVNF